MRLRAVSWIVVAALLSSELALARATVERRVRAGADMRALVAAIAQVADSTPPGSFSFVVVPDHVGSVPFARNAQGGLMLPPIQPRPLAPQLIVQLPSDLSHWPDLLERDIIGRLRREPLADVSANPMTPKVAPPHAMPDRYFCWSERARSMVELHPAFAPDLRDWDATWARVLDAAGCT